MNSHEVHLSSNTIYFSVKKNLRRLSHHPRALLWLSIFLFYLLSATLDIYTTNPGSRFMLTKNFARYFRFWIDPTDKDYYSSLDYAEFEGRIYSDKPPLLALLAVPLYWLGMVLSWILIGPQSSSWDQDFYAKIIIVLGILVLNSFAMLRVHDLLELLGYSKSTRFITTISIAIGTLYFPYAHTFFSHDIVGSLLLIATYHLLKANKMKSHEAAQKKKWMETLLAGICLGVAMGSDYFVLFLLPIFYLYITDLKQLKSILMKSKEPLIQEGLKLIFFTFPILLSGLFVLWYNWTNFKNPFTTAYEHVPIFVNFQHFLNPMTNGIEIMLFSNAHGIFLFIPLLFLAFIGLPLSLKRHPRLSILALSVFTMLVLYYSKYWKPDGGLNYGIRFLLPAIPLFMLNMAGILEDLHSQKSHFKWPLYLVFAIPSFIFSLAGGWISIFPSGGEGMQDPLFGDETGIGHVQRLVNFLSVLLDFRTLLNLSLDHSFPSETTSSLLRNFPLIAFIILVVEIFLAIMTIQVFLSDSSKPAIKKPSTSNLNSESNDKSLDTEHLKENLPYFFLNLVYVISFLYFHIHLLSKELSTIPNVEEKFKIYSEDLQIISFVALTYIILLLLTLAYENVKKDDWTDVLAYIGIIFLITWSITLFPLFSSLIIDPNKHVTIFFLILYHWGAGFIVVALVGKISRFLIQHYQLDEHDETSSIIAPKLTLTRNILWNILPALPWMWSALLTLFVFGRLQGIIFFFTFYLYRVSFLSISGLIWNVATFLEIIGILIMITRILNKLTKLFIKGHHGEASYYEH